MTQDELHRQVELLRNMILQSHHLDNTSKEIVENLLQRVQAVVMGQFLNGKPQNREDAR